MRRLLFFAFACTTLLQAHEFWIVPEKFAAVAGSPVNFTLNVGEDFTGETKPFTAVRAKALNHFSAAGREDWLDRVPKEGELARLAATFAAPGTHLLAYDSQPSTITVSAERFNAYLAEDGLDQALAARKAAGNDDKPGRERYQRCAKTLLRVSERIDATFGARTGQRLEIVPREDPLGAYAGDRLVFTVFFDERPLANAVVRAWHHRGKNLLVIKGRTDSTGRIAFELPHPGAWMISVVHLVPLENMPDLDWESFWGSLTFQLESPRA